MTAPLVPPDLEIPRLPWVPVYADRLFESNFFAVATPAEFRAAFCLWVKSWMQKPPGSLPTDDRILCRLAELGGDLAQWKKVKRIALRHWTRCDDGRLYHPVVAQLVLEAADRLKKGQQRTAAATQARQRNDREKSNVTTNVTTNVTSAKDKKGTILSENLEGKGKSLKTAPARDAPAHNTPERENGQHHANGTAGLEDINGFVPVGRFAPLRRDAPPSPALKAKKKELLRQKLLRFADARLNPADRRKAIAGLCGTDPDHNDQWWLDTLDRRMKAEHWDDTR